MQAGLGERPNFCFRELLDEARHENPPVGRTHVLTHATDADFGDGQRTVALQFDFSKWDPTPGGGPHYKAAFNGGLCFSIPVANFYKNSERRSLCLKSPKYWE